MNTQVYLSQAISFDRKSRNKLAEIERYREMATSITVANKEDKIQSSGDYDKMGSMVSKMVDLEREVEYMESVRDKIIKQIENLDDSDMYFVLYARYITNRRLADIRHDIPCSKTQIYRIHEDALSTFEKKYGDSYLEM